MHIICLKIIQITYSYVIIFEFKHYRMSLSCLSQSFFHTPEPTTANDIIYVSPQLYLINLHEYVYKMHTQIFGHINRLCYIPLKSNLNINSP